MSNMSDFIPNSIIWFNDFVERLLDPSNADPYTMLEQNQKFLDYVSFGDKTTETTHKKMFGSIPDIVEMASMDIDPEDNES